MKTMEVYCCDECPFVNHLNPYDGLGEDFICDHPEMDSCELSVARKEKGFRSRRAFTDKVHEKCPLRINPITIVFKEK
jgi:hypothetical protein